MNTTATKAMVVMLIVVVVMGQCMAGGCDKKGAGERCSRGDECCAGVCHNINGQNICPMRRIGEQGDLFAEILQKFQEEW
jgi:hypothetical protein